MAADTQGTANDPSNAHGDRRGQIPKGTNRDDRKVSRERLTLDLDPDLYQRVKLLAAQQHVSMRALIERLLREQLPSLALITRFPDGRLRPISQESVARLEAAREAVMHGRQFADTSADLIREARDERDACL